MKPTFLLWPLLAISAFSCAEVPDEGMEFSHKDWDLVCHRTGECTAMGYSPGDGIDGISVALRRKAGPREPFEGNLAFADISGDMPVAPVKLLLDGEVVGELGQNDEWMFRLNAYQSRVLVTALAGSPQIEFVDARKRAWVLSGAGATAVLVKMDALQQRVGTPGAAIKTGDGNEDFVPGPQPTLPPIERPPLVDTLPGDTLLANDPALRKALGNTLDERHPCPDLLAGKDLHIERLDEHRLLVSTQCSANSFNTATGFWVSEDRPPYLSKLVTEAGTLFDRPYAQLGSWQMQSPRGDCLVRTAWVWDGVSFVLASYAGYIRCRGFTNGAWGVSSYMR
ncbi:MAG: hypothetical protein GAK37_02430 [Pseudomonas sp.]|nr:MAG: hypothetical protein GAK37_02430 [Pseudomonas sp.]